MKHRHNQTTRAPAPAHAANLPQPVSPSPHPRILAGRPLWVPVIDTLALRPALAASVRAFSLSARKSVLQRDVNERALPRLQFLGVIIQIRHYDFNVLSRCYIFSLEQAIRSGPLLVKKDFFFKVFLFIKKTCIFTSFYLYLKF